jgi:pyridoxal phosphate enzyme (YggS family)
LDRQAAKINKVQEILVQVNLSGETTKSGITEKEAPGLMEAIIGLAHLKIGGFMTMPPFFDDPDRARPYFAALRNLKERMQAIFADKVVLTELSMGMTGDFEAAIEEGATLVRIGTALFGVRA